MAEIMVLPGVWFDRGEMAIAYCPACGLKHARKDVTAENVVSWFAHTDFVLAALGFRIEKDERPDIGKFFMEQWTQGSKDAHGYPWEVKE